MEKYGQEKPPIIDVKGIKSVPLYFFSGKYDKITHIKDNRIYASMIPAVK
jgi:hypothetical protein